MKFSTLFWVVARVVIYAVYTSSPPSTPAPAIKAEPVQTPAPPAPPAPPKPPTCNEDWRLCANNGELANSDNRDLMLAQVECKHAANELSKYGSPSWPWLSFSSYLPGNSIK